MSAATTTDVTPGYDTSAGQGKGGEDRFPSDRVLRSHGFRIHSREKGKMPVWVRGQTLFNQDFAERVVRLEIEKVQMGLSPSTSSNQMPSKKGGLGR